MRSYKVYGVKAGGSEEYVNTIHSKEEGTTVHRAMKAGGWYDKIVVRDCLGGKMFEKQLDAA